MFIHRTVKPLALSVGLVAILLTALWLVEDDVRRDPPSSELFQSWTPGVTHASQPNVPRDAVATLSQMIAQSEREPATACAQLRVRLRDAVFPVAPVTVRIRSADDVQLPNSTSIVSAPVEFGGLKAGIYYVDVVSEGWQAMPETVNLSTGQRGHVELWPTNHLDGIVTVDGGTLPAADVHLDIQAESSLWIDDSSIHPSASLTRAVASLDLVTYDGRFSLDGLPIPLEVFPPVERLVVTAKVDGRLSEPVHLEVAPTPVWSGVTLTLNTILVSGQVRVLGDQGQDHPLASAHLLLVGADSQMQDVVILNGMAFLHDRPILAETRSGPDGRFSFERPASGWTINNAAIVAVATGCIPVRTENFNPELTEAQDILLRPGCTLWVEVEVPLGPASDQEARVPLAKPAMAQVHALESTPSAHVVLAEAEMASSSSTRPDSALFVFEINGLSTGMVEVVVPFDSANGASGFPPFLTGVTELVDQQGTTLTLSPGTGMALSGTIRLPDNTEWSGVEAALFSLESSGRGPATCTAVGPNGLFELAPASVGDALVVITGRRRRSGGVAAHDLALAAIAVTVGEHQQSCPLVVDATRPEVAIDVGPEAVTEPLHLTGVTGIGVLDRWLAEGRASVLPDADGRASIFGLPPGHYTLTSAHSGTLRLDFDVDTTARVAIVRLR